jgi:hypothetical protein
MRALVTRGLLLSPLVCAALVFGPAGTAAAVDTHHEPVGRSAERSTANADALLEQLDAVDQADRGGVLTPLLDAASAITQRADGRLDAAEAAGLAQAVRTANTTVQDRLKAVDATSVNTTGSVIEHRAAVPSVDPVSDAVATVQSTVDALLKALTSLDLSSVLGAVTGLLSSVVGVVTGLLGGGLPALPSLPAAGSLPTAP